MTGETVQRYRTALGDIVETRRAYDVRCREIIEHIIIDGRDVDLRATAAPVVARRP